MRTREFPAQESGSAVLELAFSLPLFLVLILGGAEIANIAWASVQLNNAAHAAAQYASQNHANSSTTSSTNLANMEQAAQNEAPGLAITFPTAPTQVCSCVTPSSGAETAYSCSTVQANCASPNVILSSIQVTTQAVVNPLVHYPGLPASYTLQAQATMGIVP